MTRLLTSHGSAKADVMIKLVLVFFISLLSFSIGTFVGKKFSDNQYKLSQLEPHTDSEAVADGHGDQARSVASIPPGHDVTPENALSDADIAKMAEEFVEEGAEAPVLDHAAEPTAVVAKNDTKHAATEAHATTKHEAAPAPMPAAIQVSQNQPPAVRKAAQEAIRIPQSLPKETAASAIGKYTVQIGAFPSETEAQKTADGLKSQGFSAFFVPATVKGKDGAADKTWYRVSIGLFTTKVEADKYMKDLVTRKKISSGFVQQIKN